MTLVENGWTRRQGRQMGLREQSLECPMECLEEWVSGVRRVSALLGAALAGMGTLEAVADGFEPAVGLSLRADAGTSSSHLRARPLESGSAETRQSAEQWGFWLTDAHVLLSGQVFRGLHYFLDVDLLRMSDESFSVEGAPLGPRRAEEPVPALSEAWVERVESGLSFKAGRMWVRTGALELDRPAADVYQSSRLEQALPVRYLSGFEFGWLGEGQAVYLQALNNPFVPPGQAPDDLSWTVSWYGEVLRGHLRPLVTALAVPAYVARSLVRTSVTASGEEASGVPPAPLETPSGGSPSEDDHTLKRRGWLFAAGAGLEWNWGFVISSWDYNWLQSKAGLDGVPLRARAPAFSCSDAADCPFWLPLKVGVPVVMQSGAVRFDFDLTGLRPYAKLLLDHATANDSFAARSWGASFGLEYYPVESRYRTHLVFTARRDQTASETERDEYSVVFGTRLRL